MTKKSLNYTVLSCILFCFSSLPSGELSASSRMKHVRSNPQDTYVLSSFWDTIAFWKKDEVPQNFHYLNDLHPPAVNIGSTAELWDYSANIAVYKVKKFPPKAHDSESFTPSFKEFLQELKAKQLALEQTSETESDGSSVGDLPDKNEVPAAAPNETPVEPEAGSDSGNPTSTIAMVDPYASDLEAVFPRPYDRIMSEGRLLMFFPVDQPSSKNLGAPSLMLPFDPAMHFQPPSAQLERSSAAFIRE